MKKRQPLLILLLTFILAFPIYAATLPVVLEQNTTLVPLRFLSETLGYEVIFTSETEPITVRNGNSVIQFKIGSNNLNVNGQTTLLPIDIKNINGTTMVPLRVFSESLGTTTLFEDNVLYLSTGQHYWVWEIDNGKNAIKSFIPQKFFPDHTISIYSQVIVDKLLSLTPLELSKVFPGALKIPGTSNYIAYIKPNTPEESTLTFYYDFSKNTKPYCITLGQSPQVGVDIFGFNYTDGFTPSNVISKFGNPLSTNLNSDESISHLFKIGKHYMNFTFASTPHSNNNPTLYYIDLYASSYFNK